MVEEEVVETSEVAEDVEVVVTSVAEEASEVVHSEEEEDRDTDSDLHFTMTDIFVKKKYNLLLRLL